MRILLDRLGDVWAHYLCDDETCYYFLYNEKTGSGQYGQNSVGIQETQQRVALKTLPREEILTLLATEYIRMYPTKYSHDDSFYKENLKEWEKGRKLLEEYDGDLEKYDRIKPIKPERPDRLKQVIEFFGKHIKS